MVISSLLEYSLSLLDSCPCDLEAPGLSSAASTMATTVPANPTPHTVSQLLTKIADPDPDFRFMALSDLLTVFTIAKGDFLHHDYNTASRTVDHIVQALDDQNGEVQNQAIKWYHSTTNGNVPSEESWFLTQFV